LEVMVAGVLLATITTIIYGSFSQSFRVRKHAEEFYDHYRDVRLAMHRMAKEISMAYLSKHHNQQEPTTASCFKGEDNQLQFTSFAHLRLRRDADESDQSEIGYFIDTVESVKGGKVSALMRREDPTIDEDPLKGGTVNVLAENVSSITFEYWDATKEIGDEAWVDEWDACQEGNTVGERFPLLPERVRITLEIPSIKGDRKETFVVETEIMVREALDF